MSNGIRKGARIVTVLAKHGKSAPRKYHPTAGHAKSSLQRVDDDHTWRSHVLLKWLRGFSLEEAPPHSNEWTPAPRMW